MKAGRTVACLAGVLVLAGTGIATAGGWQRFAHGTAGGPSAAAEAGDAVKHPRKLRANITTEPTGQTIGVKYGTKCAKGLRISTRGRKFKGPSPMTIRPRMSFKRPDACQVNVVAAMKGDGRITIDLFVKK